MTLKSLVKQIALKCGYKITKLSSPPSLINMNLYEMANSETGVELVRYMAETGEGTDECLEKGCLPVSAHFYQPIPNLKDLEERKIWDRVSSLSGIKWQPDNFLKEIIELSEYAHECKWTEQPTQNQMDYYIGNNSFSYADAAPLYCHIRKYKPRRIIEVGSGNSSKIIAAAIVKNMSECKEYECDYTIIDPYAAIDVSLFPPGTNVLKLPVETVDLNVFSALGKDDILFIDSSHVCKIGSDVNYEILDILPILNKGVRVHFHDICLPYEYPKKFCFDKHFRMFWTEQYLLQAFLINNNNFEVYLPVSYIRNNFKEQIVRYFPDYERYGGASFWIRRI